MLLLLAKHTHCTLSQPVILHSSLHGHITNQSPYAAACGLLQGCTVVMLHTASVQGESLAEPAAPVYWSISGGKVSWLSSIQSSNSHPQLVPISLKFLTFCQFTNISDIHLKNLCFLKWINLIEFSHDLKAVMVVWIRALGQFGTATAPWHFLA